MLISWEKYNYGEVASILKDEFVPLAGKEKNPMSSSLHLQAKKVRAAVRR
jgi:hypothetical protein